MHEPPSSHQLPAISADYTRLYRNKLFKTCRIKHAKYARGKLCGHGGADYILQCFDFLLCPSAVPTKCLGLSGDASRGSGCDVMVGAGGATGLVPDVQHKSES